MKVKELIEQRLLDPRFRKAWYELAPRFDIANAMQRYRLEYGISQAELSTLTGVGLSTIVHLESCLVGPHLDTLVKLATGMGAVLEIGFNFEAMGEGEHGTPSIGGDELHEVEGRGGELTY